MYLAPQCISGFMSLVIMNCKSSETHSCSLLRAHKPPVTWGYSRPNGLEWIALTMAIKFPQQSVCRSFAGRGIISAKTAAIHTQRKVGANQLYGDSKAAPTSYGDEGLWRLCVKEASLPLDMMVLWRWVLICVSRNVWKEGCWGKEPVITSHVSCVNVDA